MANALQRVVRSALDKTGTLPIARAARDRIQPEAAGRRRFQSWLLEADKLDNQRMRVAMVAALTRQSNCIDVGAATGEFFAELHRIAPDGHHIAYEPLPAQVDALTRRFPDADVRALALANEIGETDFTHVLNAAGWSGFRASAIQTAEPPELVTVRVRMSRLDDDLPADYRPDLIKVDVNGAEEGFLLGAMNTLRRHKPLLLLEHGLAAGSYGTTSGDIHRLLVDEAGLRVFDLDGVGPLSLDEFVLAAQTKWNFLARP
jgi:FkbM family methyltransferase